jgi:hypothetical protein
VTGVSERITNFHLNSKQKGRHCQFNSTERGQLHEKEGTTMETRTIQSHAVSTGGEQDDEAIVWGEWMMEGGGGRGGRGGGASSLTCHRHLFVLQKVSVVCARQVKLEVLKRLALAQVVVVLNSEDTRAPAFHQEEDEVWGSRCE